MHILALETTGPYASAALIDEEGIVTETGGDKVYSHLQSLMPMVERLLEKQNITVEDITAVAASQGPGSFTGIRIGISSARALAQMLKIKTIPVPTLQAFAYNLPQYKGFICPILDARRSQVYGGAYRWEDGKIMEVIPGAPYSIETFTSQVEAACENAVFLGDGTEPYGKHIEKWELAEEGVRFQKAASVAQMALDLYKRGADVPYQELKPNYMRQAEAQRRLDEKK